MDLFPAPEETIVGLAPRIRSGRIRCADVVARCLERIDAHEQEIRAWVLIDRDGALSTAEARDAELDTGLDRGPLHGMPIGIKDIVDVAGWPTAAGSQQWRDRVADHDATLVSRLRNAGAVILGKTVTTQYASFDPPVTRNPWNPERTPGGSSSGSAAAVAAGMCLAAIGSQTGGSITRPASFCGVAGCKPSYGRVSVNGVLPLAPSMDHPGPIARCVDDLQTVYDVIAGFDPEDVFSRDTGIDGSISSEKAHSVPRLARLDGLFAEMSCPAVRTLFDAKLELMTSRGATIRPVRLPHEFAEILEQHGRVMAVEAAAVHEDRIARLPADYGPCITQLITQGLQTSSVEYARARWYQNRIRHDLLPYFAEYDALICPATMSVAPDRTTTGNPAFNSPWSLTGLPTVSFPMGLSPEGLPLALQLVGPYWGDSRLFETARWCEQQVRLACV